MNARLLTPAIIPPVTLGDTSSAVAIPVRPGCRPPFPGVIEAKPDGERNWRKGLAIGSHEGAGAVFIVADMHLQDGPLQEPAFGLARTRLCNDRTRMVPPMGRKAAVGQRQAVETIDCGQPPIALGYRAFRAV